MVGGIVLLCAVGYWWTGIKALLSDQFSFSIILSLVLLGGIMTVVAYLILLERKISAWIQDRHGPNRVGPLGLLQPLADGVKLLLKEDIIPDNVERAVFVLAPFIAFVISLIGYAVIPWGGEFRWPWMPEGELLRCQVASIDIGLLYLLAVGSLGVYGVVLAGWASNNKFAFYGGMRAAAQMLSYEIPMAMVILTAILTARSLRLEEMIDYQSQSLWMVVYHPIAAMIFFITALAEANRAPFDLAEAEQELIGGFHTEYSGMKWAMFFLGEYAHMITASAFMTAMFFGGYLVPGWKWLAESHSALAMFVRGGVFSLKIFILICLYMVVRWTLPRFRYDQLMRLAWKALVPITSALVLLQVWIVYQGLPQWASIVGNAIILAGAAIFAAVAHPAITGRQASLRRNDAPVERGGAVQHV